MKIAAFTFHPCYTSVSSVCLSSAKMKIKIRKDIARTDVFCFHNYKTELKVRSYSSTEDIVLCSRIYKWYMSKKKKALTIRTFIQEK